MVDDKTHKRFNFDCDGNVSEQTLAGAKRQKWQFTINATIRVDTNADGNITRAWGTAPTDQQIHNIYGALGGVGPKNK